MAIRLLLLSFQHTAARRRLALVEILAHEHFGFNTQPPEGGCSPLIHVKPGANSFNTQPPEGGWTVSSADWAGLGFQHTAARRRLGRVSQYQGCQRGFNTQPPEGGCHSGIN